MAYAMSFKMLAEDVERFEQIAFVPAKSCDSYQGFIKSEAISVEEFGKLLHKQERNG